MASKNLTGLMRHRLEGSLLVLQVQESETSDGQYYGDGRKTICCWRDAAVTDFQMVKLTGYEPTMPDAPYPLEMGTR